MMRRCPQCGSAGDDIYGFCIKCGYEFPKVELSMTNTHVPYVDLQILMKRITASNAAAL